MSAKRLYLGAAQIVSAAHVAIASNQLQASPPSNLWLDIFLRCRRIPEWIAVAQWTRLRRPCRRAEWWH